MKPSLLPLACAILISSIAANGDQAPSAQLARSEVPPLGTTIDRDNAGKFAYVIPGALRFAILHGLSITIVATERIDWPAAYLQDTEQYSGQVALGPDRAIRNYVGGLPFPAIDPRDPDAAVKIAYDWRWGPFIPGEAVLASDQKTRAFTIDPKRPARLVADDSDRDYRNENNCDAMAFVHARRDRRGASGTASADGIDWKERGDRCGPENGAVIGVQHLAPDRDDDMWVYIPGVRKWRQMKMRGGYPHGSCSYSCIQFFFEYGPPKTEVYDYRLIGRRPILACLDVPEPGAAIQVGDESARFAHLGCELRDAYVLAMTPREQSAEVILPAKVFIDSETYLYLGGEFDRGKSPDYDAALWSRVQSPDGITKMILADDFFLPGDRPNFLLSMNLTREDERLDAGETTARLFNPRAQDFSDGRSPM